MIGSRNAGVAAVSDLALIIGGPDKLFTQDGISPTWRAQISGHAQQLRLTHHVEVVSQLRRNVDRQRTIYGWTGLCAAVRRKPRVLGEVKPDVLIELSPTPVFPLTSHAANDFHLQKVLGHSTLEMTRRYANLMTEDLQAVHQRISLLAA